MPVDFTNYYQKVLDNPTATAEAKAEARQKLGLPSSSLEGTLPSPTPQRTLPQTGQGNLAIFGDMLRLASERAGQEARAEGMKNIGIDPSKVSGGTLSSMVDFVNKQTTTGISDIFKTTTKFLLDTQNNAKDQLKTLIDSGAIAQITDQALLKLSSTAGIDYDTLLSIKRAKKQEATAPSSFSIIERDGKKIRVGFDKQGNIISETDLKADVNPKATDNLEDLTPSERSSFMGWLSNQPGFDANEDIDKLKTDKQFAQKILSQYYQSDYYKTKSDMVEFIQ